MTEIDAKEFKRVPAKRIEEMEELSQTLGIVQNDDGFLMTIWKRFIRNKLAVVGLVVFILIIILALAAPYIVPYNPNTTVGAFQMKPSAQFLLGTDEIGRDTLSRLIYGTRVSLFVGVGSVLIYTLIGTTLGLFSGFLGGFWDSVIMRITEVFMSFPYMMVIIVIVSFLGPSLYTVTFVIGALGWPGLCRLVRGEVMKLKRVDYIQAAVASGYSTVQILFKHILPNVLSVILVNMTFGIAASIITEASLSFLGVGVNPPTASWGNMLANAQALTVLKYQPWRWIPAGIMILISVLAVNFFGEGLRSAILGERD